MRLSDVINIILITSSSSLSINWLKMFFYVTVLYLTTLIDCSLSSSSTLTFRPSPTTDLRRLAVDPLTGRVYVGAVNHIYQLDSNLALVVDVSTGPVQDDKTCADFNSTTGEPTCSGLSTTDNYNQILVVDNNHSQLVTCGTVFQGTCQSRRLDNSSLYKTTVAPGVTYAFVASTDATNPAVAFVAPGLSNSVRLYVGTDEVPFNYYIRQYTCGVSSRYLSSDNIFQIPTPDSELRGTFAYLSRKAATSTDFLMKYVAGFSVEGFSYFLTTQPEVYDPSDSSTPRVSKLSQVCQQDPLFDSYVEMRISCRSDSKDYNLVQAATLVQPGEILAERLGLPATEHLLVAAFYGQPDSVLCVYRLSDIRKRFTDNIQTCFNSSTLYVGRQFLGSTQYCTRDSQVTVTEDYCGSGQSSSTFSTPNSPLVGNISLESSPVKTFLFTQLTSLVSTRVDNHTVIVTTTATGYLIKMILDNVTNPVYSNYQVTQGNSGFKRDLILSPNPSHLYALTAQQVFKLPLYDCSKYVTCLRCLTAADPFCGWCTMQARCTTQSTCTNASAGDNRWKSRLTGSYSSCVVITDVLPANQWPLQRSVNLTLTVDALPTPINHEQYICEFGSSASSSMATYDANTLRCPAVVPQGAASTGQDHVTVKLTIRVLPSRVALANTQFTFYNCAALSSCTSCTSSPWRCQWCSHGNQCVDSVTSCTDNIINQTNQCPHLTPTSDILIPTGLPQTISVNARNLPALTAGEEGYMCHVHLTSGVVVMTALRHSDALVSCSSHTFSSTARDAQPVTLTVTWNNKFVIEGAANVIVYNCSAMASADCSTCLSLPYDVTRSKFNCRWCQNGCQSQATCSGSALDTCPPPIIHQVSPQSALLEGGTSVTIEGTNLGHRRDHVTSVTVAGVRCDVTHYNVSTTVVCVTRRVTAPRNGSVTVTIGNQTAVAPATVFMYKDPDVLSLSPSYGPKDGGTLITLTGTQLNTGLNQRVFVNNFTCTVIRPVSDVMITCLTPPISDAASTAAVVVQYDGGATRTLSSLTFSYHDNSVVNDVIPRDSYRSGGCRLTVTGSNLNVSSTAVLRLINDQLDIHATATPVGEWQADKLVYLSPSVNTSSEYNVSVQLDGTLSAPPVQTFTVRHDPVLNEFDNGKKTHRGDVLQIQGSGLDTECMKSAVILVGVELCNKTTVVNDELLQCTPPSQQPRPRDSSHQLPRVVVNVANLSRDLGYIEYEARESGLLTEEEIIIIGVCVGAACLIILVIVIAVVVQLKRKSTEKDRENRRLLALLFQLESSVRDQCKQAFTELHTEIPDFTSDVGDAGVPFFDYRNYAFKLLFPRNKRDHRILRTPAQNLQSPSRFGGFATLENHRFHQLLCSKYFLLVFIRTLEARHTEFNAKEKSNIASLLTVFFLDKMDYATDIIQALLEELIARSIQAKSAKVMLRRMESVVEKLLANWLSLCMYDHLRHQLPGKALYTLYQAVKCQTEKGAVDAITGEARYSLNDARLLRENIKPKQLSLSVKLKSSNVIESEATCKVLDCDTITQTKDKALDVLFTNTPYSKRPSAQDVQLYWKTGHSTESLLLLEDEDAMTETDDGWKRVNTLLHYHVKEDSEIHIVYDKQRTNSVADGEPHVVRNIHGVVELETADNVFSLRPTSQQDRVWHLVQHLPDSGTVDTRSSSTQPLRVIPEIFLTRLLTTKMTFQKFIDDLFLSIMTVDQSLPVAIKYLFDFFDTAAQRHGLTDTDVVHAWKTNSLPLRFWVNVIQNPQFIFDIRRSDSVDCCLAVIASAFIDSCSQSEHQLTKESPSSKLLFAKDIPRYREWLSKFYSNIRDSPAVSDENMRKSMLEVSKNNVTEFNLEVAVQEIYQYATRFRFELIEALNNDSSTKKLQLARNFEQINTVA